MAKTIKEQLWLLDKKPVKINGIALADGGAVYVKILDGAEHDAFVASVAEIKGEPPRGYLIAATACDETGKLIFLTPAETMPIPSPVLQRIYIMACRVNGMTTLAREEYEKNC